MTPTRTSILLTRGLRARADRRGARRQMPSQLTPCRITLPDDSCPVGGWLHNLSVKGAGLLLEKPCDAGTAVSILIVNAAHTYSLALEMRVVRCYRVSSGDHFVGGQFDRQLTFDQIVPFFM
jgi:hypothetical protein